MLLKIACRNILAHRVQSLVIFAIIMGGTFLSIIGQSIYASMSNGIRKSVTQSIAGDLQIYSKEKDVEFSVFGDETNEFPDIGVIPNFAQLKSKILTQIPEVTYVVPQGINMAMQNAGNLLDRKLSDFRESKKEDSEFRKAIKNHLRQISTQIAKNYFLNSEGFIRMSKEDTTETKKILDRVQNDQFWNEISVEYDDIHAVSKNKELSTTQKNIDLLENKITPLMADESMMFFLYVGTNPKEMLNAFPLIEVVKGSNIPEGKPGFLLNEYAYEKMLKNKIALRLDTLRLQIKDDGLAIAQNKAMSDAIKTNVIQSTELVYQISPEKVPAMIVSMQQHLQSPNNDLAELFKEFFNFTDQNFEIRYDFFYKKIAPNILLYRYQVGDTMTLTAYHKGGSVKNLTIKIYGIFKFKGIEHSPTSGYFSIMDLVSYRKLYNFATPASALESKELASAMSKSLSKFSAGDQDIEAMFSQEVTETKPQNGSQSFDFDVVIDRQAKEAEALYTNADYENGAVPNAAVVLKDPDTTLTVKNKLEELFKKENLNLKVEPWLKTSGILGQVASVFKQILFGFLGIVYFVAIFIIMNAVMTSTLERLREFGTMRAIGAQRQFLMKLIVVEISLVSICSSFFAGIVCWLLLLTLKKGIPIYSEIFEFVFSGPRILLSFELVDALAAALVAWFVCILASIYPLVKAIYVSPITALRNE